MKYFDLSEADSWKIHMLFSPRLVPTWLTENQIQFCIGLHDRVYPQGTQVSNGKLIELWRAIKTIDKIKEADFLECLSWIFNAKMEINKDLKRGNAYIEFHLNYADSLPPWQRDEYLRRFWGGN